MSGGHDTAQQLRKTIQMAREFASAVDPGMLLARRGEVHARPCSGGIALVSLHPDSPQLGQSGLSPLAAARCFGTFGAGRVPGRSTPEKALQASILADAYRHGRRLQFIERAAEATWFITDELMLFDAAGDKVVCDLLGVGLRGAHLVPVVIELKSERTLVRLVEQVTSYARIVDEHPALIGELASAILRRPIAISGRAEKWILWPGLPSGVEKHDQFLASEGIRRVSYRFADAGYSFA